MRRHLSELPSIRNGLSFTQQMALELIAASPISYAVDGRQYVAVSGTGGLFSFALPR